MVEHFLLTPADLPLVWTCRGGTNLCGMALLLKALTYLDYVPGSLDGVLMTYAGQRLRHLQVELPADRELQRVVDAELNGFFRKSTDVWPRLYPPTSALV